MSEKNTNEENEIKEVKCYEYRGSLFKIFEEAQDVKRARVIIDTLRIAKCSGADFVFTHFHEIKEAIEEISARLKAEGLD